MKTIFTDTEGPHGGKVKDAVHYNIESKVVSDTFYAYLLNKENKSIKNKGLTCKIQFFIIDGSTIEIPMNRYGEEGFTLEYFAHDFDTYSVIFKESGKVIQAKFESENLMAKKNKERAPNYENGTLILITPR